MMAKLDHRKRLILEVIRELERPIWAGDVSSRPVEQELMRDAFHALCEEGIIRRLPSSVGQRVFYELV